MTRDEFEQECRKLCPLCASGTQLRYRPETREFVHDSRSQASFSITICRANKFRNDHENEEFSGG